MAKSGKPPAKKPAQNKTTGKKPPAKKAAAASGNKAAGKRRQQSRHQVAAILLLAGAVLVLCLLLISGDHVWKLMRQLLLGLFGVCAFTLPPLMVYIAVLAAQEKPNGFLARKLWQGGLVLLALCSAIQVFVTDVTGDYWQALGSAYLTGREMKNGGFFGAVLGYPFEYCFTDIGAKIIICLLAFVAVMLMTGTSIIKLFHALWKPVEKTRASIRDAIDYDEELDEQEQPAAFSGGGGTRLAAPPPEKERGGCGFGRGLPARS